METIAASEARANFSEILGRVSFGKERIAIERHGKTVALLVPASESNLTAAEDRRHEPAPSESDGRYRAVTDIIPVGIFHTDAAGDVKYVNEKWCEIGGMTPDAALGKGWLKAIHPDDRERVGTDWYYSSNPRKFFEDEYRYMNSDGETTWCFVQSRPEYDEAGDLIGYVGSLTDITKRKQAEEALRVSGERAANSYRSAKITYWEWSKETGKITHLPGSYAQTDDGIYESPFSSYEEFFPLVHDDDRDRVMECYERVDKQGLDFEIDYRVLRFDGEVRHIRELGTAVFDDTGQFTGHTGTHQDITELREREIALRESEQRYREIFEESPVGIWEDDWSDVKRMLDHLAAGGVTDLRKHFHDNPDKLMEVYDQVKHIDIGRSTIELYGAPSKQTLKDWLRAKVVTDEELDGFLECLIAFRNGEFSFEYDAPQLRFDGALFVTSNSVVIPLQSRHDWSRVFYAIENITERKQAEKDRQQSVQRLEDIAAAASDWFWEMDADLRFTYISDRYEEVAGISSDFFFGKRMDESYPRSVKKFPLAWKTYFEAVAERRDFRDFVHDDIRRDGLRRVISNTGKAIFDEDGNFQGYRGTSTDITDQRVAEEALRDSQAMLTDAIESISEGFVLYDSEERLVICNDNYRKSFPMVAELMVPGAKLEDLLRIAGERGQVKHDMVSVEDWIEQRLEEYHSDGHEPIEQQLSDGRWILAGERRTREGGIVGIRTDITDVKRAEEAVRTRDAWLKGILENSPLEIVLKDTAGRIMATSRTVQETHGLSREKMVGLRSSDFLPAELAEIYMSADRKVMETGKLFQQEVSENREDGSIRHMLNAKFPLKDDEGHILGTCSLATDITEMKQVQAQLHQAQKMEAVGKLTGGIAHDFNNLLAIVMGNLELIEEESKDSDSIALYLAAAFTAADNAATLTHRLLAFSRNQPLMPKIVDTNSLVSKMLGLLERTLEEDIVIVADYGDDLAPVSIDSGQLENALLNLVVNARDAMPKGGKIFIETDSVTVDRAAAENDHGLSPGDYISLTVRDTGDGMPQDVLDHAFEPFFTTKGVGEGSGLGLSMVFGFANQSGGNVEISSEQGHGTAVTLYLPATTAEITDIEKPDPDVVKDGGGKTILFVDDNEEVSRVVVAQLTSMGFKVHQAHDGKSALDALDKFPAIDLLLTDVKMPGGMDGAELALEARCRRPRLPVLYASGYSADALKKSGQLEDNAQLIEKPFKRRALAARIASMLS